MPSRSLVRDPGQRGTPISRFTQIDGLRTSESVTEGHPDKVADFIADSLLDAHLAQDPGARVAVEVLVKDDRVVVAGEITARSSVDLEDVVRTAIREIGYTDSSEPFYADSVRILPLLSAQAGEIARGVGNGAGQGAGDQGFMVGYATAETPALLPLPILLAHAITGQLARDRKRGAVPWLRPDGKAQVTVRYRDGTPIDVAHVLVSTQHAEGVKHGEIEGYLRETLLPAALGRWLGPTTEVTVNPAGTFVQGGPSADCGVTGRKIIVDTYGGAARHGGGGFSGKDPSKVDRSAAYFCRWAARQVVQSGLARRVEIEVAYAIGRAEPMAIRVETFGTGDCGAVEELVRSFDFRPWVMIEHLGLRRPIYRSTTNYGHFGRSGLPWET